MWESTEKISRWKLENRKNKWAQSAQYWGRTIKVVAEWASNWGRKEIKDAWANLNSLSQARCENGIEKNIPFGRGRNFTNSLLIVI